MTPIQYYATATYPCNYLEGRIARAQVVDSSTPSRVRLYSDLIRDGFRRSGTYIYRPHCDHCQACISIRIPVNEFRPNRSQRRAVSIHKELVTTISTPFFSEEHYALYQRYQRARHENSGMDQDDVSQYNEFLVNTSVASQLIEFRDSGPTGDLRMVSIVDELNDGLSAVYTFYEPVPSQSYGTFNVMWLIERARSIAKPYVYLGYWVNDCRKMSYKTRFQPYELLQGGRWQRNSPASVSHPPTNDDVYGLA